MPSQIELYEELSFLSARMVEAARANDWNSLVELEQDISGLRQSLTTSVEDSDVLATDLARKQRLIQRILEDDAEVRRHTEPWMDRLRKYLGDGGYGAVARRLPDTNTEDSTPGCLGA